ncbi:MAG: hypothetical protein AAFR36_17420, partial [Bacteroidota bacterium]
MNAASSCWNTLCTVTRSVSLFLFGMLLLPNFLSAQTNLDDDELVQIDYSGSAEDFRIPNSVDNSMLRFVLRGADGGRSCSVIRSRGGRGANLELLFPIGDDEGELEAGGTIRFIVGEKGGSNDANMSGGGGGGGGTAILYHAPGAVLDGSTVPSLDIADADTKWVLLAVAGGGGGGYGVAREDGSCDLNLADPGSSGADGTSGTNGGTSSTEINTSTGGMNGNGGQSYLISNHGGPGGGYLTDGNGNNADDDLIGLRGGIAGGDGGFHTDDHSVGGWGYGGGGGSRYGTDLGVGAGTGGGGGGGYSGGGGGNRKNSGYGNPGGGGGSFVNTTTAVDGSDVFTLMDPPSTPRDGFIQYEFLRMETNRSTVYSLPLMQAVQEFIIPEDLASNTNTVTFTARGGDGGRARRNAFGLASVGARGGEGAVVTATFAVGDGLFELERGGSLRFITGFAGDSKTSQSNHGGGGGGGTAVLYKPPGVVRNGDCTIGTDNDPTPSLDLNQDCWVVLMVAGGGGGGFIRQNSLDNGLNANVNSNGTSKGGSNDGSGGTNGAPGGVGSADGGETVDAGGGGGYRVPFSEPHRAQGRQGVFTGDEGGTGADNYRAGGWGYGSGGSGRLERNNSGRRGAGGGGGFSGGGGGYRDAGGGGGSWVNPAAQSSSISIPNQTNESLNGNLSYKWGKILETGPVAVCQSTIQVYINGDERYTLEPEMVDAGSYDPDDDDAVLDIAFCVPDGINEPLCGVTGLGFDCDDIGDTFDESYAFLEVTNAAGESDFCTFTIEVVRGNVGVLTCPPNQTIDKELTVCDALILDGNAPSQLNLQPTAFATCNDQLTYAIINPDGSINTDQAIFSPDVGILRNNFSAGTSEVLYFSSYQDASGVENAQTCSFEVTLEPEGGPFSMDCPENAVLITDGPAACSASGSITGPVDLEVDYDGPGALTYTVVGPGDSPTVTTGSGQVSGFDFALGLNTVTYMAACAEEEYANCTFTVTVEYESDQAPDLSCIDTDPPNRLDLSVGSGIDAQTLAEQIIISATDDCGIIGYEVDFVGEASITCSDVGDNLDVDVTVYDVSGNSAECEARITVVDDFGVTCPESVSVDIDEIGSCTADIDASLLATVTQYLCQGDLDYQVSYNDNGLFTFVDAGPGEIPTLEDLETGITYTATYNAERTDGLHTSSCSFTITVNDIEPPVAVCDFITVYTDSDPAVDALSMGGNSTDNCGIASYSLSVDRSCEDIGVQFATLTVTDHAGNQDQCSRFIQVSDRLGPVNMACPGDEILTVIPGTCDIVIPDYTTSSIDDWTDNCGGTITLIQSPAPGSLISRAVVEVIIYAEDESENQSEDDCRFNLIRNDLSPPVIECEDVVVQVGADNSERVRAELIPVSADDFCDNPVFSFDPDGLVDEMFFTCDDVGINPVIVYALEEDSYINSAECAANIIVQSEDLTLFCEQNVLVVPLDDTGAGMVTVEDILIDFEVSCGDLTLSFSPTELITELEYDCEDIMMEEDIMLYATDAGGRMAECQTRIRVGDNVTQLECADQIVTVDDAQGATLTVDEIVTAVEDNCFEDLEVNFTLEPGANQRTQEFSCDDFGEQTLTVYAYTNNFNDITGQCEITVSVQSETVAIQCQEIVRVSLDDEGRGTVFAEELDDNSIVSCIGDDLFFLIDGEYLEMEFNCEDLGTQVLTLVVRDQLGNLQGTCESTIEIVDELPPLIECNDSEWVVEVADGDVGILHVEDVAVYLEDNCFSSPLLSFEPDAIVETLEFTCADIGEQGILVYGHDSGTFYELNDCLTTVIVRSSEIVMQCREGVIVSLDDAGNGLLTIEDFDDGSFTNCSDQPLVLSFSPDEIVDVLEFNCSQLGGAVPMYGYDDGGATGECEAFVEVADNLPPMARCEEYFLIFIEEETFFLTIDEINGNSEDNCTSEENLIIEILEADGTGIGNEIPLDCDYLGIREFSMLVIDEAGNEDLCSFQVEVQDLIEPVAECKNSLLVTVSGEAVTITADDVDNGSFDNCEIVSRTLDRNTFDCEDVDMPTFVTLTVSDGTNTSLCETEIQVVAASAVVARCEDATLSLDADGNATLTVSDIDDGSVAGCDEMITFSFSPDEVITELSYTCEDIGMLGVTLYVSNDNGGADECTATVSIEDDLAPAANCVNSLTIGLSESPLLATQINDGSTDNCTADEDLSFFMLATDVGGAPLGATYNLDCGVVGDLNITLDVRDESNNLSSCDMTVTVVDDIPPVAICQDITIAIEDEPVFITPDQINNGSTDNCGSVMLSLDRTEFDCVDVGEMIDVTLSISDGTNTSTCTGTVTVEDNTPPVASCGMGIVTLDENGEGTLLASELDGFMGSSDNCGPLLFSFDESGLVTSMDYNCEDRGQFDITLYVHDAGGNTTSCTASVLVEDQSAPNAICATGLVVGISETPLLASQLDNGSTDNCTPEEELDFQMALIVNDTGDPEQDYEFIGASLDLSFSDVGTLDLLLIVRDDEGETGICEASVTVVDDVPPTAICQNITVELIDDMATITPEQIDNGSNDGDGGMVTLSLDQTSFDCNNLGDNLVTLTVTDEAGNISRCNATVTITREPDVTFTALDDLCIDEGIQTGLGNGTPIGGVYSGPGVVDDGNGETYTFDPAAAGLGTHSITYSFVPHPAEENELVPLGSEIVGANLTSRIDYGLALSASGNIMAVGEPDFDSPGLEDNGKVIVYTKDGNDWVPLGNELLGTENFENFGDYVSLSNDGNRLLVESVFDFEPPGGTASSIRTYDWTGTAWVQVGQELSFFCPNIGFAGDAKLSGTGQRFIYLDECGGAVTYELIAGVWTEVDQISGGVDEVAISASGDRIGVLQGGPRNTVRVREWTGAAWVDVGTEIEPPLGFSSDIEANESATLTFSADGNRLAYGFTDIGFRYVEGILGVTFEWDGTEWQQLGRALSVGRLVNTSPNGLVYLVDNGNRLVLIEPLNDDFEIGPGGLRIFEWDGSCWIEIAKAGPELISGYSSLRTVEASANGTTIALGFVGTPSDLSEIVVKTLSLNFSCEQAGTATDEVTVTGPVVSFTAPAAVSVDAGVQTGLGGGTPVGGVYAGPGVTDDGNGMTYSFDPAAAGVGTHVLSYQFTDENDCSNTATDIIEVLPLPFTAPDDLCIDAGLQTGLDGGFPLGGQYSGPGVTDDGNGISYTFDPATAGVGVHDITYTYSECLAGEDAFPQFGTPLQGVNTGDRFGTSVSLSADGMRMAVGAPRADESALEDNGKVTVYQRVGDQWQPLGKPIKGEIAEDRFGMAVSLSDDGNRLLVQSEIAFTNLVGFTFTQGNVRVYDWTGSKWKQVGLNVLSDTGFVPLFGSAAISGNGQRFIMEDRFELNGEGLSIHELVDGIAWVEIGRFPVGGSDVVAITSDGNRIADLNAFGILTIREYDGTSWVQLGNEIFLPDFALNTLSPLTFSQDGNRIACGLFDTDPGGAVVFEWDGSSWQQLGDVVSLGLSGSECGSQGHLADDGNRLVVLSECFSNNPGGPRKIMGVFEWNGTEWVELGRQEDLQFGDLRAFSGAGDKIALAENFGGAGDEGEVTTYCINENCNNVETVLTDQVEVFAVPTVTLSTITSVCINEGLQTGLGGGLPEGGVYTGPGVMDDGNGLTYSFDPAVTGLGIQAVSYTLVDDNSCTGTAEGQIEVLPAAENPIVENITICEGAGSTEITPNGTVLFWSETFDEEGAGIEGPCGNSDPNSCSQFNPPSNGQWTITGQVDRLGELFLVENGRFLAQDLNGRICVLSEEIDISEYSSVDFSALFESDGPGSNDYMEISLIVDGVATEIPNWMGLGSADRTLVDDFGSTVITQEGISGNTLQIEICARNNFSVERYFFDDITLTGNLTRVYNFFDADPSTGNANLLAGPVESYDPMTTSANSPQSIWVVQSAEPCDSDAEEVIITVNPLPVLSFTAPEDLCVDAGLQTDLGGATPAGGTYSGPGVTDDGNGTTYSFDPVTAGVGVHTITYEFTDENACFNSISDEVEVFDLSEVTFDFQTTQICLNDPVLADQSGGAPLGGTYTGPGVTDNGDGTFDFDPAAAGVGLHIITYTLVDGNSCSSSASVALQVFDLPEVNFTALDDLCVNDEVQTELGGGTPAGGVYSGPGVTDDGNGLTYSFDPAAAGVGTHSITYTAAGLSNITISQLGEAITTFQGNDLFDLSAAISANGERIAIRVGDGADDAMTFVQVYQWNGSSWQQLGQNIDERIDLSPYANGSLAFAADGNRLAIGTRRPPGPLTPGLVSVYDWNGSSWSQIGVDIIGEENADQFGRSLSLSTDGNRIAIGATSNDDAEIDAGHVRILEFDGTGWTQLGEDIDGEARGDGSGIAVSLSADGTRVAIGADGNDDTGGNAGHVRVYEYDGSSWVQLGQDIDAEEANDQSGFSVSLSADGSRVAIGAYGNEANIGVEGIGHVRVYDWNGTSWVQAGQDIDGDGNLLSFTGYAVSLSGDGNRLAVGSPMFSTALSTFGKFDIYDWDGSVWVRYAEGVPSQAINSEFGTTVALSTDGSTVISGAMPFAMDTNGEYRMYSVEEFFCTNFAFDEVEVFDLPEVDLTAEDFYCVDAPMQSAVITGGGSPMGGVYSGPGITDGGDGSTYFLDPMVAGVGTLTLSYTVTDDNGCSNTATAEIEIVACEVAVQDPCSCLDNASIIDLDMGTGGADGQFSEIVAIIDANGTPLPSNQVWTVTAATGASDAYNIPTIGVQSAGVPIATDGSVTLTFNATNGAYELPFVHVDGIAYSITVEGPFALGSPFNTVQSISNLCQYPNPVFDPALPDFICSTESAITLDGTDTNGGTDDAITFTIDGTPATEFDPIALGVGFYTVVMTYDGADDDNGGVSPDGGTTPAAPGCTQTVQKVVEVGGLPPILTCPADDFGLPMGCNPIVPVAATTFNLLGDPNPDPALPTVEDGCGTLTLTSSDAISDTGCTRALTRTYTITDQNGDSDTCEHTFTFTVDTDRPSFNEALPMDLTVECDAIPAAATLTASDNCTPAIMVSFMEVRTDGVCPQTYILTRTWTTEADDCGNPGITHTQVVTVQDTTSPSFNEALPTDMTVECDAVPMAAVLTATDNCDPEVPVSFNEVRTDTDCPQEYLLTRTWSAQDDCGNPVSHTQRITVEDTTPPVAVCNTIRIFLNEAGMYTLTQADIDAIAAGASDNCDDDFTYSIDQTMFNCDDIDLTIGAIGGAEVEMTFEDCAGNTSMCIAIVEIDDSAVPFNFGCIADINVTLDEECSALITPDMLVTGFDDCIDSYNIMLDGQDTDVLTGCGDHNYMIELVEDGEVVYICWGEILAEDKTDPVVVCQDDVSDANTFFSNVRAAGTLDVTQPTLDFSTITCLTKPDILPGEHPYEVFTATANSFNGEPSTVTYLVGGELMGGSTNSTQLYIYQGAFDPAHPCQNIFATSASGELDAQYDPYTGSITVELPALESQLYTFVVTNDDPSALGQVFVVQEFNDQGNPLMSFSEEDFRFIGGRVLGVRDLVCSDIEEILLEEPVTYISNPNFSGQQGIDDFATRNLLFDGNVQAYIAYNLLGRLGRLRFYLPQAFDNCNRVAVTVSTEHVVTGDCADEQVIVTYTATEFREDGCPGEERSVSCTQVFTVRKPTIDDVFLPPSELTIECDQVFDTDGSAGGPDENPRPSYAGAPWLRTAWDNIVLDGDATYCNLGVTYSDSPRIELCEGGYSFVREWSIQDWCDPASNLLYSQVIKVKDYTGPELSGIDETIHVSASPLACVANILIPTPVVTDGNGCSSATATTYTILAFGETFFAGGNVGDGDIVQAPIGTHTLIICAEDDCLNETCEEYTLVVTDEIEPNAICDDELNVSIGGGDVLNGIEGIARIFAEDIDEGSNDNCGSVTLEVRRNFWRSGTCDASANRWSPWGEFVDFYCCDIANEITIELRVTDESGNQNTCWMTVTPEDKLNPFCYAPQNVTLTCNELPLTFPGNIEEAYDEDFGGTSDLMNAIFGAASGTDNCAVDTIVERTPNININECGWGSITRRFEAWQLRPEGDVNGNGAIDINEVFRSTNSCSQSIIINEVHDFTIDFPEDADADCGDPDVPTVITDTDGCDVLSVNIGEPVLFTATGDECYKYSITYDVINWCLWDGEYTGYVIPRMTEDDGESLPIDRAVEGNERPVVTYNDDDGLCIDRRHSDRDGDSFLPNCDSPTLPNYGRYIYTQFVKVYDSSAPVVTVGDFGGPTDNCPDLLPGQFGDDDGNCEEAVSIPFSVTDECELFDTDGNLVISIVSAELDAFAVDASGDGQIQSSEFAADFNVIGNITDNGDGTYSFDGTYPIITEEMGANVFHAVRILLED